MGEGGNGLGDSDNELDDQVYCYCKRPIPFDTPRTIGCDAKKEWCKEWYHLECIQQEEGVETCRHAEEMAKEESAEAIWSCGLCKQ